MQDKENTKKPPKAVFCVAQRRTPPNSKASQKKYTTEQIKEK